jgi:hypothetical protein
LNSASPFQSLENQFMKKPEPLGSGAVESASNQPPSRCTVPLNNLKLLEVVESLFTAQNPVIELAPPSPSPDVSPQFFASNFHLQTASSLYPPPKEFKAPDTLLNPLDLNPSSPECILNSYRFNRPRVLVSKHCKGSGRPS